MFSCQNSKQETINKPVEKPLLNEKEYILEKEEKDEIEKLYIVEGKAVIFFLLNKSELNKLTKELGSSYRYETDFLFNNYTHQAKEFKKLLAKYNIKSELIRNKKFLIKLKNGQTVRFNRIREDQIMGEIISDGIQDPVIEFGMYQNKDLAELLQKYFQIENLGFVQQDSVPLEIPAEEKMSVDSTKQMVVQ